MKRCKIHEHGGFLQTQSQLWHLIYRIAGNIGGNYIWQSVLLAVLLNISLLNTGDVTVQ